MPRILNAIRHLKNLFQPQQGLAPSQTPHVPVPTPSSRVRDHGVFNEGDRVLIKHGNLYRLSAPLSAVSKTSIKSGAFRHDAIIGQPLGALKVRTSKTTVVALDNPTLDEYISKSPRLVQPIYSHYATTIVDLLDIHVHPFSSEGTRVDILDAGTGHGSLSLHLARAVAAANPPPPDLPFPELRLKSSHAGAVTPQAREQAELQQSWDKYRNSRNAVVHTVERVLDNSIHAEKIIRGFRQGVYWHHLNFYTGRVGDWIAERCARGPFLSYVTMDLPAVHEELASLSSALLPDGRLCVFAPSITQIADCLRVIDDKKLALYLDKVVELGEGISTGRVWDLRYFIPRARAEPPGKPKAVDPTLDTEDDDPTERSESTSEDSPTGKVLICRPKVGTRLVGGGFVGLFRKTPPDDVVVNPEVHRLLKAGDELGRRETRGVEEGYSSEGDERAVEEREMERKG